MRKLPDNFLFGVITSILMIGLCCFLLYGIRLIMISHYGSSNMFEEPKLQLIAVAVNVLLFRLAMVNLRKEKTGRGILFTTVMLTFIYLFLYTRFHFRMTPTISPAKDSEVIHV